MKNKLPTLISIVVSIIITLTFGKASGAEKDPALKKENILIQYSPLEDATLQVHETRDVYVEESPGKDVIITTGYNEKGNTLFEYWFRGEDSEYNKTVMFEYNKKGQLIKAKHINAYGKLIRMTRWTHDKEGGIKKAYNYIYDGGKKILLGMK